MSSVAYSVPETTGTTPAHTPPPTATPIPSALQRACLAAKCAVENKGVDVMILDLRPLTPIFDFFVLATGTSRRLVHTIVEEVDATLRAVGDVRTGIGGYESSKWVVQDYGDVLMHVFDPETRDYYKLDELWADAPRIDWQEEIEIE
ncbi:MAG: ribosome silencing factor [Gemmataceae bacterium]